MMLSCSRDFYATGVYLVPMMIHVGGVEKWIWVAEDTDNDVFYNDSAISLNLLADSKDALIADN